MDCVANLVFRDDLQLFSAWFAQPVSDVCLRGTARKYRRLHRRVRLQRQDQTSPQTRKIAAIPPGDKWQAAVEGQTSDLVLRLGLVCFPGACSALF